MTLTYETTFLMFIVIPRSFRMKWVSMTWQTYALLAPKKYVTNGA